MKIVCPVCKSADGFILRRAQRSVWEKGRESCRETGEVQAVECVACGCYANDDKRDNKSHTLRAFGVVDGD